MERIADWREERRGVSSAGDMDMEVSEGAGMVENWWLSVPIKGRLFTQQQQKKPPGDEELSSALEFQKLPFWDFRCGAHGDVAVRSGEYVIPRPGCAGLGLWSVGAG